jgi:hypothetical protein
MQFTAGREISLFIGNAMPVLAHTQLGCKNHLDFGAAPLPLSLAEFQNAPLLLAAFRLHGFVLNYSQVQLCC